MFKKWYSANVSGDQGLIISEEDGKNIAVSYDAKDAPLIAAAPELKQALDNMLVLVERYLSEEQEYIWRPQIEAAREAARKAEGK